eukprot:CAMPEP_0203760060 /NCGR_PEP_ID=MMETSP0098-20131031/13446_1 /ASSEMBLY_ACC=CAM_ASM_000208 /TAXON_ID=96639 /ORGANISM=" , Strain NY0313808BC1" /LENGTH=163 /DNA_ID=CAMNT_0050653497 /DNA_START=91 /DNA_END=579 /DNA_ORIENTATION=-
MKQVLIFFSLCILGVFGNEHPGVYIYTVRSFLGCNAVYNFDGSADGTHCYEFDDNDCTKNAVWLPAKSNETLRKPGTWRNIRCSEKNGLDVYFRGLVDVPSIDGVIDGRYYFESATGAKTKVHLARREATSLSIIPMCVWSAHEKDWEHHNVTLNSWFSLESQ